MKICYLQHVPFEGPGGSADWFRSRGDEVIISHIYKGDVLPLPSEADWLFVMGGPMGSGDEGLFPWLRAEKKCISAFIEADKIVVGICLGAQLIAEVLGAAVYRNEFPEIGWFPLYSVKGSGESCLSDLIPGEFQGFHWHEDTFDIPSEAVHLVSSQGCRNQAFSLNDRVFAFQFHLETTPESLALLIENEADEIRQDLYVQSGPDMKSRTEFYSELESLMSRVLQRIKDSAC